jgi:hypothetical protein
MLNYTQIVSKIVDGELLMLSRRVRFHGLIFGIVLLSVGAAASVKRPISVVVQPISESSSLFYKVAVKVSITNNSRQTIWFASRCPEPYTVKLTDSHGQLVAYEHPQVSDLDCGANGIIAIVPGTTWTTEITLSGLFDLKADKYSIRVEWRFPWNVQKTGHARYDNDILTVSSNTAELAVRP